MFAASPRLLICLALPAAFAFSGAPAGEVSSGLAAYREANFAIALPLLRNEAAKSPADPALQAALLSSLVYQNKVDEASDLDEHLAAAFPNDSAVTTARAELAFHMADMPQAEKLFKQALRLKEETPHAYLGLCALFRAASCYRTARLACLRAYALDPDDALVKQSWLRYATPEKRKELLPPFAAAHPWLYQNFAENRESASAIQTAIQHNQIFERVDGTQEGTLHLVLIMRDATRFTGVGLEFRIARQRPLRLLFDTGASGILLKQSAIDKAGLDHLGKDQAWGVGDKGPKDMFASVAPTCEIGSLKFKTCVIGALAGKASFGNEDGLIGADVFSDYIVQIDFQKRLMHLKPLPSRPPDPQGYDRVIPPDEKSFTPVFRFGHHLYVLTRVNNKCTGLFLIDFGAAMSNIDSTFARLSTKIHGDDMMRVSGISGQVNHVFEADKAELQFARFRQSNLGLTSFDLNNSSRHQDVRMSGILGFPVLYLFRLTIDYRNGLVDFDYHPH